MKHYFFHITPLEHLPQIISSSGLLPARDILAAGDPPHWWTGEQVRRRGSEVPCRPRGALMEYVSLYMYRHPPQLHRTPHMSPHDWVYMVTTLDHILDARLPFCFTDGDPLLTGLTSFYPSSHPVRVPDADLLRHDDWRHRPTDLDLDRRRSASLLAKGTLTWRSIAGIAVATSEQQTRVHQMLRAQDKMKDVIIRPMWF